MIVARAGLCSKCSCGSSSIACFINAQQSLREKDPPLVPQEEAGTSIQHVMIEKEILYTAKAGVNKHRHNVVPKFQFLPFSFLS